MLKNGVPLHNDVVDGKNPLAHEIWVVEVVPDLLLRLTFQGTADMDQVTTCIGETLVSLYLTLGKVQFRFITDKTLTAILTY